jgi:hypothetical protein
MFLLLGFFLSVPLLLAQSSDKPNLQELAKSPKWRRLLHYKKAYLSQWKSEADGKAFFFHADGKRNPALELEASLQALRAPFEASKAEEHALCRFPARRRWFVAQGLLPAEAASVTCPRFDQFRRVVDGEKVSLVFSSYYLNNPSSAFGHTFLRIHRKESQKMGKNAELLDSGVNYAAHTTTTNAMLYGIYGLLGVFQGYYAKLPYYYKVREYADFESRDLWSFGLNLSQAQVDEMVEHLWELGQTNFDYFFLDENCSYHLLSLLEVLNPEWDFTSKQATLFVIPAETVKTLARTPGLLGEISFRPSSRRVFETTYADLSASEREDFFKIIDARDPGVLPAGRDNETRRRVFDAAIDYWDFKEAKAILNEEKAAMDLKQRYLVARSQVPLVSPMKKAQIPLSDAPTESHDPAAFGLGGGYSDFDETFVDLHYRAAFHNKIDYLPGSPTHTTMEVLDTQLRYSLEKNRPYLQNLSLMRIESLNPMRSYYYPISWNIKFGAERVGEDSHCRKDECMAAVFRIGGGGTVELPARIFASLLGDYQLGGSYGFTRSFLRQSMGPHLIVYRPMTSRLGVAFDARYFYHPFFAPRWTYSHSLKLNFAWTKNLGTILEWEQSLKGHVGSAALRYTY